MRIWRIPWWVHPWFLHENYATWLGRGFCVTFPFLLSMVRRKHIWLMAVWYFHLAAHQKPPNVIVCFYATFWMNVKCVCAKNQDIRKKSDQLLPKWVSSRQWTHKVCVLILGYSFVGKISFQTDFLWKFSLKPWCVYLMVSSGSTEHR